MLKAYPLTCPIALLQQAVTVRFRKRDGEGCCLGRPKGQYWSNKRLPWSIPNMTQAINDRIKELEFQDCKVRVTNVDSQASDQNIVIQVIGEISNKSAPHKKFTQTFVLAGQTNGYFVLNDIFRYIVEEEDEVIAEDAQEEQVQEPAPTAAAESTEPETLTSSADPAAIEEAAAKVDKELEEQVASEAPAAEEVEAPESPINGTDGAEAADSEPITTVPVTDTEAPEAVPEPSVPEPIQEEKPKDPDPTPVASPPKQASAQPAAPVAQPAPSAPSKPAAPKTWATLAAAAARVTPAVPVPQASASAAPQAQPKAAPVATQAAPATSSPASAGAPAREPSPVASQQDEWTSVGGDHKRQQSKAQAAAGAQEIPQHRAYIKNVSESIDNKTLRDELEKYGEILYFDVARQKASFTQPKLEDGLSY